jgi:probable rRNA maturation factor
LPTRKLSIAVAVLVEAGEWPGEAALAAVAKAALAAAVDVLALAIAEPPELSLVFTDDAHIRELNAAWRGRDKPTNVLSFPLAAIEPGASLPPMLGDIVLACETVRREAEAEEKPFEHHLAHLIVHGFLHLLGYDHEEEGEAERMEETERRILAELAIPDPYR